MVDLGSTLARETVTTWGCHFPSVGMMYFYAMQLDRPSSRQTLWSQSGQFWLGAFMVAEAPLSLVVMMFPEITRVALLDWVFSGALTMLLSIGMLIALGILVGLAAHRLGWGE